MRHAAPTLISLFAGAGGLDLGLETAGFQTVAAIDLDADCCESLSKNQAADISIPGSAERAYLKGSRLVHSPIEEVAARHFRPASASATWRPDLLAGGPPCQPFSSSGKQHSLNDPRGRLFEDFVRLAQALRPRLILFENVRGLVTARGPNGKPGEALRLVLQTLESIGYATSCAVLNAADYGLAQRRVRLFILASQYAPLPRFPAPTHAEQGGADLFESRKRWISLGEFLAGQPPPRPEELTRPGPNLERQLRGVPEGSGLKSPGPKEPTRPGGHWGYKQGTFIADSSKPARTVTAASTQDWVRLPDGSLRRLTFRECAALQGFPPEWKFVGTKASQFRQVGNAVPSVFGRVLGKALLDALETQRPRTRAQSAALPAQVVSAIDYATRDDQRNGVSRVRSTLYRGRRG
jgi:DNA (cytosine-5)-methyltransferase 1